MASRNLGTLTLDLIAKTSNFEQGMGRAQRKVGAVESDLNRMIARADKAALALATFAAGAAAGMVALTARTARAMDATSKMADQIGTTTEALTGLRFAAQQFANVSDQQFDMALRRMTRRIEEAAQGSGGAKAAFDAMGLSAKELSRLSADEQFMRIADAMQKTDTQAQRLKNTMAIFDTEGMPLVTALVQGSEELERNIELATRYGVVLSTQAAKSAEQFSTNLSRLGQIQEGYRQQLTTALLPALEKASGYMLGVAESALEVGNSRDRLQSFSDAAVEMVDDIARSYAGLLEIGRGVMDMLEALDEAALGWLEPFKQETQSAASILSQSFSESILNTAREIDKLVGFAGGVRAAWEAASGSIPGFFRQAWNNVLIGAAEFVNNLAGLVNPMLETLGMEGFAGVSWGENIVVGQRSITEAFKEGYEAAKEASGMAARVQAAYERVGVSAASAASSLGGTNGSGGGGRNLTGSTKAAQKASEDFRKEQQRALQSQYQSISALHDQAQALEDQIAVYGLGKAAIEDLNIARLEEQATLLRGFDGSEEAVEAIEREIEARRRLRTAIGSMEQKEAERAAWEGWERDVEQIFNRVGQSLTDAIFEGGRSGKDLLKDIFKSLTFNVLINPVMQAGQQWVTNQLGGAFGYQNPQQQSGGSSFTGGGTFGAGAVSDIGGWLSTSGVAPDVGAKMVMNADKIAGAAGNVLGYGKAIYDFTQGKYGSAAGTAIGTAVAGPIGAAVGSFLGGAVDGLFDREPTTRREQRTQIEFANGLFGTTRTDDRMPGADAAARALAEQAVSTANDIFKQVGVDAAIDSFHAIMASSYKGDRDGVASGGTLRIGDQLRQFGIANEGNPTIQGFGGWSDVDTLPRLAIDVSMSLMEALQAAGVMAHRLDGLDIRGMGEEQVTALATTIQQVVQEIAGFDAVIAQLPFANLRDLSFEARDGLLMLSGGLDRLIAAEQSYLQNFYSEAERTQLTWDAISRTLGEVNIAVPETRDEFRAIKESLDLNTESGRQAYAAIMSVQDAFASVTLSADELAEASKRAAEEDARIAKQRRDDALAHLSEAYNAMVQAGQREIAKLQESFSATDSAMNAYRSKVQEYINSFNGLFSAIDQGVKALRGTGAALEADYNRARAVISTTLLTGQLPQTADLSDALRVAQQGVTGQVYASRFEQEKAYAILANEMEAIKEIAEPELDAAQATLNQLEDQYRLLRGMSRVGEDSLESLEAQLRTALSTEEVARSQITLVESQLETARLQYNALAGIDDTLTKGFADLVAAFEKAAAAVPPSVGGGGGGGGTGNAIGAGSDYQRAVDYYRNNPDVADAFNKSSGQNFADFAKEHYEKYGRAEGRPSFAIGTNYVPYDMTAQIHKGERIIPAADNRALIQALQSGGRGDREAVGLLREQIAELRQQNRYMYELVKSGKRTALNTEDTAMAIAHGDSGGAVVVYG